MESELDIGTLYISLHNLLRKNTINGKVSRKQFYCILGKHFLIPKNIRCHTIKEMEKRNLVKWIDRDNLIILNYNIDTKQDADKLFQSVGLF
jgi:hypothetical protein